MMPKLSLLQQQVAAIVLGFVLLSLVMGVTVLPVAVTAIDNVEKIGSLKEKLSIYKRILSAKKNVKSELEDYRKNPPGKDFYLYSESESLALAALQNIVRKTVEKHGAVVVSTNTVSQKKNKDVKNGLSNALTVMVKMRSEIEALQRIFFDLETSKPLMVLDRLQIDSSKRRGRDKDKDKDKDKKRLLVVQFTVTCFFREK